MKKSLPAALALFCFVLHYQANAQYDDYYDGSLFSRPKAIALTLGTQGVGIDFTQNISFGLSARLGASYLPFSYKYSGLYGNVNSDVKLKTKSFLNAHLLFDWFPLEELGLKITPGVGYFFNAKSIATVTPQGNYKYGDINLTSEDIGTMTGTLEWKGLAPYLGAGWLFSFQEGESPLSITVDLGTYYLSRPDATLTGTRLLENNSYNQTRFQENTKNYRWLPVLQASLRYNL